MVTGNSITAFGRAGSLFCYWKKSTIENALAGAIFIAGYKFYFSYNTFANRFVPAEFINKQSFLFCIK